VTQQYAGFGSSEGARVGELEGIVEVGKLVGPKVGKAVGYVEGKFVVGLSDGDIDGIPGSSVDI